MQHDYKNANILKDLQGNNFKFYRGCDSYSYIPRGIFFCNCYDIARKYGENVFESEIRLANPIVIDATSGGGYSGYEYLCIEVGKFYPESKRSELLHYMKQLGMGTISTDEVMCWARQHEDVDGVIIKNVREGINPEIPIYDVMIWDENSLVNCVNITQNNKDIVEFQKYTLKRVDLSNYLKEKDNQDGILNISYYEGYNIEHRIIKVKNGTYIIDNVLVAVTNKKSVKIYCDELKKNMECIRDECGGYKYLAFLGEEDILTEQGRIEIHGLLLRMQNFKIIENE